MDVALSDPSLKEGSKANFPAMRILSGIKPSGEIHFGNYLGMLKPMIESQSRGELLCFIANLHGLTSVMGGAQMAAWTRQMAIDILALGMDPERSVFWIQSDVAEVTELAWYLSNFTPVGLLERCHAYKDAVAHGKSPNHGLFAYPVLMAADIVGFGVNKVPVGKDQKQHVEVARDLVDSFNSRYGEIFVKPDPEIDSDVATVQGLDGQKMSKSYGNTVGIFAEPSEVKKKIMAIATDSTPLEEPKDPEANPVFAWYKQVAYFEPYRKRREDISQDKDGLRSILAKGAERARAILAPTLDQVRHVVGIRWHELV